MTSAGDWGRREAFEVDADELYRQSPQQGDASTKGFMVDLVSTFGGVLLLITSAMELLQGVAAIHNDDLYSDGSEYLYQFDMQVWGTIHIVVAVLSAIVGLGILARKAWAQVGGVVVASFAILGNFAFLPRYPVWSLVVIALDVLVIWALLTQLRRTQ